MDFANERYVRLYTRDTLGWEMLGWQGQTVFALLYRKADRSGVISLSGREPWVAALGLCKLPEDVARSGMAALLREEWVVHDGDRLVFPRYIEANETPQSDAQRAKEYRARRAQLKSKAADESSRNVTPESRNVLDPSRGITSRHSVPSRADLNQEELRNPPPAGAREEQSSFRVGHDLCREANGGQYGSEWRRQLEAIGAKPAAERAAVLAAIQADPWCLKNKHAVDPTHVLKHWARYVAGNPPIKSVVRSSSRYAGPSEVAKPEDYAVKGEIKW